MQDILKSNTPAFVFDTAALKKRVAQIKEDCRGNSITLLFDESKSVFCTGHDNVCG